MKKYRGQVLKQVGNVTYVCFNPELKSSKQNGEIPFDGSLALTQE